MPFYPYRCEVCKNVHEPYRSIMDDLPVFITCECGGRMRRFYTPPAFHRFTEHFNAAVGKPVSRMKDFESELRRAEDTMSERLGYQQHYAVVEPTPVTYDDKGMDMTHDHRKASGMST